MKFDSDRQFFAIFALLTAIIAILLFVVGYVFGQSNTTTETSIAAEETATVTTTTNTATPALTEDANQNEEMVVEFQSEETKTYTAIKNGTTVTVYETNLEDESLEEVFSYEEAFAYSPQSGNAHEAAAPSVDYDAQSDTFVFAENGGLTLYNIASGERTQIAEILSTPEGVAATGVEWSRPEIGENTWQFRSPQFSPSGRFISVLKLYYEGASVAVYDTSRDNFIMLATDENRSAFEATPHWGGSDQLIVENSLFFAEPRAYLYSGFEDVIASPVISMQPTTVIELENTQEYTNDGEGIIESMIVDDNHVVYKAETLDYNDEQLVWLGQRWIEIRSLDDNETTTIASRESQEGDLQLLYADAKMVIYTGTDGIVYKYDIETEETTSWDFGEIIWVQFVDAESNTLYYTSTANTALNKLMLDGQTREATAIEFTGALQAMQ